MAKNRILRFIPFLAIVIFTGCKDTYCIECVAVHKEKKTILRSVQECSKDYDYLVGYEDGFRHSEIGLSDSVEVVCSEIYKSD